MVALAQSSTNVNWVMHQIDIREWQRVLEAQAPLPQQSASSRSRISPTLLYVIVILAVVFFISGLLHLLVRFLIKRRSRAPSSPHGNVEEDISDSEAIQRQLQQLFHLHDSGLDQAFIDALPIFLYKELVGAKEPFDCAVCLCEFAADDKLRLLPVCSHAFHLDCIDTWLLSNSTCPLCRGTLFTQGMAMENSIYDFDNPREESGADRDLEVAGDAEKMVFSVRLGKFKSLQSANTGEGRELCSTNKSVMANDLRGDEGESSSSSLDRRCYSMGSYQYVVGESILQVALSTGGRRANGRGGVGVGSFGNAIGEGMEGRRLCVGGRGESFSVSKIWQWSDKNGKFPIPSDLASLDGSLAFQWKGIGREGRSRLLSA